MTKKKGWKCPKCDKTLEYKFHKLFSDAPYCTGNPENQHSPVKMEEVELK